MNYISTRGKSEPVGFSDAVLMGLARDGGLLLPESYPDFSERLTELASLSYVDLAIEIFKPFVNSELTDEELKQLVDNSYSSFASEEVTPLLFGKSHHLLELYQGPTLAFKDVALQFLGNLFEILLKKTGKTLNILGATSGDTGSAAIYGVRGKENINIFMLHPKGKVSPIQERQMTTVLDDNVHNIAIHGNFDDGQRIVKEIFGDLNFRDEYALGAVNSINWARIMAQITYYFYAAFRLREKSPELPLQFSVPTGNFGDILAGYIAKQMGLPVNRLIIATNENDILARVIETGRYSLQDVHATLSPSMDIQISSNFERLLFDACGRDADKVNQLMDDLKSNGEFVLDDEPLTYIRKLFSAKRVDTEQTLNTIRSVYEQEGWIIDPHTAVGVAAAEEISAQPVICLATADAAKFPAAVERAINTSPPQPKALDGIFDKETRCLESEPSSDSVKSIIRQHV
jgi:threonine synthase